MPKRPKGMFRRGRSFYVRVWEGGQGQLGVPRCGLRRGLQDAPSPAQGRKAGAGWLRTVRDVAERWLTVYVPTARGEKQVRMSRTRVSKYLAEFMGHKPLVPVKPDDFREYRLWLEGQELKPMTVVHLLSDARCFFNWCVDTGVLDRSPFPRRVMPRVQEVPPDRLTDEEVEAVLSIREPYAFVVRLALGTGLRWGELTRAQASDVEQGMLVVSQTKSSRLRRVPLSPELLAETRGRVGRLVGYSWK
jgi:integrase